MKLYDDQTGELLGEVSEDDVQFLIDRLEEEEAEDRAYYVNQDTLQLLEEGGASAVLKSALRRAVQTKGEVEVRWSEE